MKGQWHSDRDPLAALQRGDPLLFEQFVQTEAPTFIGFFERLGADRAEAEDLAQEVFLKLYRNAASYDSRSAFEAFALRVARNAWIDRGRRRAARPVVRSFDAPGAPDLASERRISGAEADPGHALGVREESQRLREALRGLSRMHALVFELAVVQSRPYAEIAEELNIPVGTVKSRVFNALRKLRAALEEEKPRR